MVGVEHAKEASRCWDEPKSSRASTPQLDKNFVGFDHADLSACTLFNHLKADLQIQQLSAVALVGDLSLAVQAQLLRQLLLKLHDFRYAPTTNPQLSLQDNKQEQQGPSDGALRHGDELERGDVKQFAIL
jgi:hypothetical protein